jgi:hypothetical protein
MDHLLCFCIAIAWDLGQEAWLSCQKLNCANTRVEKKFGQYPHTHAPTYSPRTIFCPLKTAKDLETNLRITKLSCQTCWVGLRTMKGFLPPFQWDFCFGCFTTGISTANNPLLDTVPKHKMQIIAEVQWYITSEWFCLTVPNMGFDSLMEDGGVKPPSNTKHQNPSQINTTLGKAMTPPPSPPPPDHHHPTTTHHPPPTTHHPHTECFEI